MVSQYFPKRYNDPQKKKKKRDTMTPVVCHFMCLFLFLLSSQKPLLQQHKDFHTDLYKELRLSTNLTQCLLHHGFTLIVQCRGGHVQKQDLWVSDKGSGNGYSLFLATTHLASSFSNKSVKLLGRKPHQR